MATVFISHANQDDALTGDLLRWLHGNGFRDTFVDHLDILGGENWTDRLRDQAASCRVVICVITDHWLASSECFNEFQAAWYMGKSILPLFLVDRTDARGEEPARRLSRVLNETQGIDLRGALTAGGGLGLAQDHSTADLLDRSLRAFGAQSEIGLDPTAFATDPAARPTPFPGLVSYGDSDADAAIFFGRSREIAEAIEELRSMRANADRRPLVILGVSGAGKSSVLKAGILPRLRREMQSWLPLRAFRPGIDPLGSFAAALSRTLADLGETEPPGQIRARLERALAAATPAAAADGDTDEALPGPVQEALDGLADRLRRAAGTPGATILISVDQAEELLRADSAAAGQLSACLAAALAGRRGWLTAFTIRADRFPDLQGHPGFRDIKARGYDLRQLPAFRFSDVIEGPAARYGVKLAPDLVDAFMEDAPERDALPLLAFALQRLWDQFSASGALRLQDYQALGGMSGMIRDAAERALAGLKPTDGQASPPDAARMQGRIDLAERCFVPALVDVNEARGATRRTAYWTEFDAEQQDLLRQFEAWRLVVRRGVGAGATVEVAHEALFREWPRMRDWLEPEIHRIEVLRGTADAARLWDQSGRRPVLLNHRGARLADAQALLFAPRYGDRLGATERAYLTACTRLRRRGIATFAAVAALALAALGLGTWSYLQSERRMIAEREAGFATRVADATGVSDISTLESFTNYILTDAYARTRPDRFDVLRTVLTEAQTAVDPEYAIAGYALDAMDSVEGGAFELEYAAERGVDAALFPVLWRPHAVLLARDHGLPAPRHFVLVENPDFPPGRVVIRSGGAVVFDGVLPATDRRHMLDRAALDRDDLRAFFEANRAAFEPAEPVTGSADHFYVPDWSVPIWNAGRDRNTGSRVIPPGADFTILLGNLMRARPEIVIDELAVEHFLDMIPEAFRVTVSEYRAIRGPMARDDVLAWLRAGHSLGDLLFSLGALAAQGPEAPAAEPLAAAVDRTPDAAPRIHGAVLSADAAGTQQTNAGVAESAGRGGVKSGEAKGPGSTTVDTRPPEEAVVAGSRLAELETSFRHLDLRTAPIRVRLPLPPPGQGVDGWDPLTRAVYRDGTLLLSRRFREAQADMLGDLFRRTGLFGLGIEIAPDAALPAGHFTVEILDGAPGAPLSADAGDPDAAVAAVLDAVRARIEAAPDRFVFPHSLGGYLDAVSPARRRWTQETFSHTDLAQLVAGLIRHGAARRGPDANPHAPSVLLQFDWLSGALAYSVAAHGVGDGAAHLALWRDLADGAPSPPGDTVVLGVEPKIAEGIERLIAEDMAGAGAAFAAAAALDASAARGHFLALYAGIAPELLFARIRSECETPTAPGLGVIEAQQLELLLDSLADGDGTAIDAAEQVHFQLCLLGARAAADPEDWLDAALAFAAGLRGPEDLAPDLALWLGQTLWRLQDPLSDRAGVLAVGRRFLQSAVERIDAPERLDRIGDALASDCYARIDTRPCMRRIAELAEQGGRPALALYATEALAGSIYPDDHRRAAALLDLYQATYGPEPDFAGGFSDWYAAYLRYQRGLLLFSSGTPGSPEWQEAKGHLTRAMEHAAFRFSVLPSLSKVLIDVDGHAAAEALATRALFDTTFSDVDPIHLANLHSLRFSLAVEAGHGEDFLDNLVSLPQATGCAGRFTDRCIAAWLWRATAQVVYRHADWQTVARTVISRIDHPYSTLIALMLNAQGGKVAGSPALLRRNWERVDPALWERRIELEDEAVWREILLGYAVGETVAGYEPEALLAVLQDPAVFAGHPLSRIGLRREELLTEALFYTAMLEIAGGRIDAGVDLLRRTRAVGYWQALEHAFARPLLAQLEERQN